MSEEEAIMEPKEEEEEEEEQEGQEEGEEESEEEATGENDEENNDEGDNPDQEGEDQEQGEEVPEGEEGEKEETEEQGEETPEVEDKQVSFQEEPTPPPPAKGPSGPIPKNVLNRLITDNLYWEELYNKGRQTTSFRCPNGQLAKMPCPVPATDRNLMYENRMLGVPRLRQLRTGNQSCIIHPDFEKAIKRCHASYSYSTEDTSVLRWPQPQFRKYTSEDAWRYRDATQTGSTTFRGQMTTYGGGGSTQNLGYQKNISKVILEELKENLWIDQGTRLVVLDFTVYNGNINLFAVIKLIYEFPASGGIIPSMDIEIVKLLKYNDSSDYILMAVEVLFGLFVLYYLIEEGIEIKTHGMGYFMNMGNVLDIIVIGVSVTQIILNLVNIIMVRQVLQNLIQLPFEYADFGALCNQVKALTYLSGFNVFVAWIKDLVNASYTLFRTILGDFNFEVIEQADWLFGPLYFISYIFFVFFVLLNVFLAIINDTYGQVKAQIASRKPAFQMGDFFMVGVNNVKMAAGIRDRSLDVENAVKKAAEDDGFVTYQELRENLKHSNFSDLEIDLYFEQFKEDPEMAGMLIDDEEDDKEQEETDEDRAKRLEAMLDNENEADLGIKDEDGGDDEDLNGQSRRSSARSARPKTGLNETDGSESRRSSARPKTGFNEGEGSTSRRASARPKTGMRDENENNEEELDEAALRASARPKSGREARLMRSAKIRDAAKGAQHLPAQRFYDLEEKLGRMEMSVGPINNKLDKLLNKLDDMKRKRGKKDRVKLMMKSIESDKNLKDDVRQRQINDLLQYTER